MLRLILGTAGKKKTANLGALRARKVLLGSAALIVALSASSGAWAQCRDNFNFITNTGAGFAPLSALFPLGTGTAISSLTSTINTVNTAFLTSTSAFVSAPGGAQPDQQGGGAWARTISGTADTSANSVATVSPVGLVPVTGTQNCATTTRQDYWGYQVGHDISVLNGGGTGANFHVGVTAGYLEARNKDTTPAGSYTSAALGGPFFTPGGTFSADSQVPFVGFYGAFTKGNFALDGQARWDFYQSRLNDPNNGLSSQALDARGFTLTGNTSYNIPLHGNWFVEPSAGAVWSRVTIDSLNVPGVPIIAGIPPLGFSAGRGSLTIDDIESVLGRASVRVGTTFTQGAVTWQPFFTASVFHEFAGDVTSRSVAQNPGSNIDGVVMTTRSEGGIGTYGQFALGTAAVLGNTGWLGYGRVDYRIGENIEGWSVNAGLRYQFTPGTRGSLKDGPAPAVYSYNWTGPYIGLYVGSMWGEAHAVASAGAGPFAGLAVQPDFAGTIGGGQVGYNIQMGKTVVGIEADYGFSNAHGGVSCPGALGFFYTCEAELHRLAMFTGRVGLTWGRALLYAKGGLAGGEVTGGTKLNPFVPLPVLPASSTNWQVGWTVGGGMEFAVTDRWSAKAEYMHYDLGRDTFTTFVGDPGTQASTRGDTVRVGVNLHFSPVQKEVPLK